MSWNEGKIGRALARSTFRTDLCVLPNTVWTGDEIDLLVVTPDLRVVDVEIKISRADLKRDRDKPKWWHQDWRYVNGQRPPAVARAWPGPPGRVWKHYYAMPACIWTEALLEHVQPVSGVLLVVEDCYGRESVECIKRARPNRDATRLGDVMVAEIARLASLRMWDAYRELEGPVDAARRSA